MNQQKLNDIVSHIDYLVSELKHLRTKLCLEDGLHFNVIANNEMFAIELWDTELLEPRILSYIPRFISSEEEKKECIKALNQLGIRAYKKQIYWNSEVPWDSLPENFRKLDQVYKIEKRELTSSLREEVQGRLDALYHISAE